MTASRLGVGSARRVTDSPGLAPRPQSNRVVDEEEWRTRVELAACHRLVARFGMSDFTATHVSARVRGEPAGFLFKPHHLFFEEVTASSLLKVDFSGCGLGNGDPALNPAGFNIHSAVLRARADVRCVIHTHTEAGMALSALACGLLPVCQDAIRFHHRIGYHLYEGIVDDPAERTRLVASLGPHHALILRNHGLLTAGRTVAEAFRLIHMLERACRVQLDAMSSGAELTLPPEAVCEHAAGQFDAMGTMGGRDWRGHLRDLERSDPSYRM